MLLFYPDAVMVSGVLLSLHGERFISKNWLLPRSCCETRPGFSFQAQKWEIEFKGHFSPVNGPDGKLYVFWFRVHFRRIFKQGRERVATMTRVAAFRIIKIIFAPILAKSRVFGVSVESVTNYAKGFGN